MNRHLISHFGAVELLENLETFLPDRESVVLVPFINKTGKQLVRGDVVAVSNNAAESVEQEDSTTILRPYVVAAETINPNVRGFFALPPSQVPCRFTGTINNGDFIRKSATAFAVETLNLGIGDVPLNEIGLVFPGVLGYAVEDYTPGAKVVRCQLIPMALSTLDRRNYFQLVEDFFATDDGASHGSGITEHWTYPWNRQGGVTAGVSAIKVHGTGTVRGRLFLVSHNGAYSLFCAATDFLAYEMRYAQEGGGASTRRMGMSNTQMTTAEPANGLYIRHALDGNMIAVARNANAETTVDTGVAAGAGVKSHVTLVAYNPAAGGAQQAKVWVDHAFKGTLTTNVPGTQLGCSGDGARTGTNDGFTLYLVAIAGRRID